MKSLKHGMKTIWKLPEKGKKLCKKSENWIESNFPVAHWHEVIRAKPSNFSRKIISNQNIYTQPNDQLRIRWPIRNFQICKISKTYLLCIFSQKYSGGNKARAMNQGLRCGRDKGRALQELDGERSRDDDSVIERNQSTWEWNRRLQENFQNSETDGVPVVLEVLRENLDFWEFKDRYVPYT